MHKILISFMLVSVLGLSHTNTIKDYYLNLYAGLTTDVQRAATIIWDGYL